MRDDISDYLADLIRRSRDVLGDDLVGAYAAGSVGLGAYQPGRSDADVALVRSCHVLRAPGGHLLCVIPVASDGALVESTATRWP
ncbi:hypothetical protein [Micromonospora sp. CNB394]|uniref:hypothetical protein n=1 Tax=Micromonospora sp. CNB394 TaxID=1169151 RepID=UPI00039F39FE|nr:hypothetical protein [Micromonospora sp. CNB394]